MLAGLVNALMPVIPMGAALWLLFKMVKLFEAYLIDLKRENESMKETLQRQREEELENKEDQLAEMQERLDDMQAKLDKQQTPLRRSVRGQSPAARRG